MYWTDFGVRLTLGFGRIRRSSLDGSGTEDLVADGSGIKGPTSIALDLTHGKMYWGDQITHKIQRANLDGSSVEDLVTKDSAGIDNPLGIALDLINGKVYWTDIEPPNSSIGTKKIQRANLDGTGVEDLVTAADGILSPNGIELDVANGKMYWVDNRTHKIQRANLDGTAVEDILTSSDGIQRGPVEITLDLINRKMYWFDSGDPNTSVKRIRRANFDGTQLEELVPNAVEREGGIAVQIQ